MHKKRSGLSGFTISHSNNKKIVYVSVHFTSTSVITAIRSVPANVSEAVIKNGAKKTTGPAVFTHQYSSTHTFS